MAFVLTLLSFATVPTGEFVVENRCQPALVVVNRIPTPVAPVPAPAQQWISYDGGRTWQPYTPGVTDAPSLPAAMPVQSWGSVSGGGCANGQCGTQSSGGFFRRR